jgi:hypothetical protein
VGLLLGGALTEYLSWRWTLYVNLIFAAAALAAQLAHPVHLGFPGGGRGAARGFRSLAGPGGQSAAAAAGSTGP